MSRSYPRINSGKLVGGRYRIISQLGAGGFGQTFLAEDVHLPGRPRCVVKQLQPQTEDISALQMARRCFNTEAQVLYKLGNHDQIPRLMAHFEEEQEFYLVQEFIEGESLTKELVKGKPWTQSRAIALLKDVLHVLAFVHEQQVIHRDLKPSNLIRRKQDSRMVLIDFGAVKQVSTPTPDVETGLTNLTISIGTQGYMPNEQVAGKPRFSSDVYAVGIIGIQALTGTHPRYLKEDTKGEIEWHHLVPYGSSELLEVMDCMVRYDFRDRYATAIEALAALESLPPYVTESPTLSQVFVDLMPEADFDEERNLTAAIPESPPMSSAEITVEEEPASTEIWVQAEGVPAEPTKTVASASIYNTAKPTQIIGRPYQVQAQPASALTVKQKPSFRRLLLPWSVLGIVAGMVGAGVTFALVRVMTPSPPPPPAEVNVRPAATIAGIAEDAIATVIPADPAEQLADLMRRAQRSQQSNLHEQALRYYGRAIQLKPDLAEAYWGRCDSLNALKRPAEAIVACNDALAYQRNYPEAIYGLGNAYSLQGRWYDALRQYERATRLKSDFALAWVKRGAALQELGRSAEALTALDRAISLNRNSAEAWTTRGEALWNLGRYDDAIIALDKALSLQPNHEEARKLRQRAKDELGR